MTGAGQHFEQKIEQYLDDCRSKSTLRFMTCGSVDDGKSTLIGRMLYDLNALFTDQLESLQKASKKFGTQGESIDFSLLVDGLCAEREQGITIDVAYRYFSTSTRQFIVADTPGHVQYTRNMITGASTAEVAILIIDARKGLSTQSCRHSYLVSLMGISQLVIAINKMDLVGYSEKVFQKIATDYQRFAQKLGIKSVLFIPTSALYGDNLVASSTRMNWYQGPTLITFLETVEIDHSVKQKKSFRMPVQWVNRPHLNFRGFAGQISSGTAKPGDKICVLPSGKVSRIKRIVSYEGDLELAVSGQSITLVIQDEIDISRGDLISSSFDSASVAQQFNATIIWMGEQALLPGRTYLMQIGSQTVTVMITAIQYQMDICSLTPLAVAELGLNEIGECHIKLDQRIPFDPYIKNRDTGSFIIIDQITNHTVGAGLINFPLSVRQNISVQQHDVDKHVRAACKNQHPCVIWLTGLSGAGKSTIANLIEKKLHGMGHHTYLLDGDNIRWGLNKDLGFTREDRVENIRRVAEVATLMVDAGLIVIAAFISPFNAERKMVRTLLEDGEFIEVFVDTPLEVAERRDVKGLYKKARLGELKNFTGIDSPYETPDNPDYVISTTGISAEQAAEQFINQLLQGGKWGDKS